MTAAKVALLAIIARTGPHAGSRSGSVNGSLDARSDIFSFGAVLYEIVTGHQPFAAESGAMTISAIVSREPAPLARYSRGVPSELERIVSKALHKDRDERYQTTRDLLIDLRSLKHHLEIEKELEHSAAPRADEEAVARKRALASRLVPSDRNKIAATNINAANRNLTNPFQPACCRHNS